MIRSKRVGKCIFDTSHQLKLKLDASFDKTDLNGLQARILGFVEHNEGCGKAVYQRDIEAEFKIRRSSVSSVLDTMEKNGYIIREAVSTDARLKKLVLTEKAKKAAIQHRDAIDRFEQNIVKNMTAEEIETLKMLLEKVLDNAESMGGN